MEGIITKNGKYVEVSNETTKPYPISKKQKNHGLSDGSKVTIEIDTEYPESCDNDPFCEGDETCMICLYNNKVAIIKTK